MKDKRYEGVASEFLAIIGGIFKDIREENHLTQREAGEILGTSSARVSYIENGILDMKVSTLVTLAQAYGQDISISFDELEEDDDRKVRFRNAVQGRRTGRDQVRQQGPQRSLRRSERRPDHDGSEVRGSGDSVRDHGGDRPRGSTQPVAGSLLDKYGKK